MQPVFAEGLIIEQVYDFQNDDSLIFAYSISNI